MVGRKVATGNTLQTAAAAVESEVGIAEMGIEHTTGRSKTNRECLPDKLGKGDRNRSPVAPEDIALLMPTGAGSARHICHKVGMGTAVYLVAILV